MSLICPTVTATEPAQYATQIDHLKSFAKRIHIDSTDGIFVPSKLVDVEHISWPEGMLADIHMMHKHPSEHLATLISLKPHLVIVHAEAAGDFLGFAEQLHKADIKVGVAMLPTTKPEVLRPALEYIDHVLIFSGHLGHFGGHADMDLLTKAQACKHLKAELEIGWDGGINESNVHILAAGGVDVLNVGGFIQNASDPADAYATLVGKL